MKMNDIEQMIRLGRIDDVYAEIANVKTKIAEEKRVAAEKARKEKEKNDLIKKAEDELVNALIAYFAAKGYAVSEEDTKIMRKILNSTFEMPGDTFFDWYFNKQ